MREKVKLRKWKVDAIYNTPDVASAMGRRIVTRGEQDRKRSLSNSSAFLKNMRFWRALPVCRLPWPEPS
jgi:hypothetical protein